MALRRRYFCSSSNSSGSKLFSRGLGVFGVLGHGADLSNVKLFRQISAAPDENTILIEPIKVSSGWGHSAFVNKHGKLSIFGRPYELSNIMQINRIHNISQRLARWVARLTNIFGEKTSGVYSTPVLIDGLENVVDVSCSGGLTLATNSNGNVFAFGLNRWGQCGKTTVADGNSGNSAEAKSIGIHVYSPFQLSLPFICIADAGFQHCIALSDQGVIYTWGKGSRGQLGNGAIESHAAAQKIKLRDENNKVLKCTAVTAGFAHCAALAEDGSVWVWGKGMSTTSKKTTVMAYEDQTTPRKVDLPDNRQCIEVCSSNFSVVMRASDGTLWALGLGEHDRNFISCPMPVLDLLPLPASESNSISNSSDTSSVDSSSIIISRPGIDTDPVILRQNSPLKKGHKRVAAIVHRPQQIHHDFQALNEAERNIASGSGSQGHDIVCEVILHNHEAYLKQVDTLEFEDHASFTDMAIEDYSCGWQHTLMIAGKRKC